VNTAEQIRSFLAENFMLSSDGFTLADDASLLEAGVVDSTGILELTMFVEDTFGVEVADQEIVPENFDTVNAIVDYVASKKPSTVSS